MNSRTKISTPHLKYKKNKIKIKTVYVGSIYGKSLSFLFWRTDFIFLLDTRGLVASHALQLWEYSIHYRKKNNYLIRRMIAGWQVCHSWCWLSRCFITVLLNLQWADFKWILTIYSFIFTGLVLVSSLTNKMFGKVNLIAVIVEEFGPTLFLYDAALKFAGISSCTALLRSHHSISVWLRSGLS